MTRRSRLVLLAALMALVPHAGGAQELRIATASEVTSLDPHFFNVAANNNIAWHVFDALTRVDENARLIPGLAESWRAVDPTTWEFKLRRNVKFHDGTELTAEDVVFSLDRPHTIGNSPGSFVPFTRPLVEKRAVDRYTVRLRTAQPYAMVPYDLNSVFIVSRRAARGATTEDFNSGRAAIGTGPYRVVAFQRGKRVTLARHEAYWGRRPAWSSVTFVVMPDSRARTAALLAGDVDVIENVRPADIRKLRVRSDVRLEQKVSWRTVFLHLDQAYNRSQKLTNSAGEPLTTNPLKDLRVRRAISKAIDRKALTERVLGGLGLPASNLIPPGVFGYAPDLAVEPFDPVGARKLLAEAGFPNGFGLTISAPVNRYVNDRAIATELAKMLNNAGFTARVEVFPFSVYVNKARNREFSVALLGWGSFSGDLALRSIVATFDADKGYGTWNWGRYSNAQVDRLVRTALATIDDARREAMAQEAMRIAMRDLAVVPLHHEVVVWAMRSDLRYAARRDEYTLAQHIRPR